MPEALRATWETIPARSGALEIRRTEFGKFVSDGGEPWLALSRLARAERRSAINIADAIHESLPRAITAFERIVSKQEMEIQSVQCHRCGRQLNAPEVHILDGDPDTARPASSTSLAAMDRGDHPSG